MYQLRLINRFTPFVRNKAKIRLEIANTLLYAQRTWTRHKMAAQSGHETLLVQVGRDDRDVFPSLRKVLCLVIKRLSERITANSVH